MRDMVNGILVSTAYNPLFAGMSYPDFRRLSFKNIRGVTCMALNPSVITMEGFNATLRPEITLDNVVFDNINPKLSVAAEFAKIHLGPGNVNFDARRARASTSCPTRATAAIPPKDCKFPKLPAPQAPPGWVH